MKKLFSLLAMISMFSLVWAEEYEYEEVYEDEYEDVVETPKPKAKSKKMAATGNTRIGLSVGLSGDSKMVNVVYDMGTGKEILIGLDAQMYKDAAGDGVTAIGIAAGLNYDLGKALLPYGVGGVFTLYNAHMSAGWADEDMPKQMALNPYFYVKAPIAKNFDASVKAGIYHIMPDEGDAFTTIRTTADLTFYFL